MKSLALSDGRAFYLAMQFFGVPSELVVYPRTGHGLEEPRLIEDSWKRNLRWFDYWLKGKEYPDALKSQYYDAWKQKQADCLLALQAQICVYPG